VLAGVLTGGVTGVVDIAAGITVAVGVSTVAETGAGLACKYSGPFWPQALSRPVRRVKMAMALKREIRKEEFTMGITIRITVT
jgi:hypothetical protein